MTDPTDATTEEPPEVPAGTIQATVAVEGEVVAETGTGATAVVGATEDESSASLSVPSSYVPLEYVGVEMVLPSTHPVLILREKAGSRRELQIPIGTAEGVAIAYAARSIATPRPLTHELFSSVLAGFDLTLETVRITAVERTSYTAEMVVTGARGIRVFPCRVSDGVCLALRQRLEVPVTAAEGVLDVASFDTGTATTG